MDLRQFLLITHFIGLSMGFSVSFANMIIGGLAAKANPGDKAVFARIPPAMVRVGDLGLILLWGSGLWLLFGYWGGMDAFSVLPWQFHVKITGVVILSGLIGYIHTLLRKARNGDAAAAALIPTIGKIAFVTALTIVVMAVLTFN